MRLATRKSRHPERVIEIKTLIDKWLADAGTPSAYKGTEGRNTVAGTSAYAAAAPPAEAICEPPAGCAIGFQYNQ
jgi:hypothetical protein